MSLRDARAAALTRWHRDLADDFARTLPRLLDDLEVIDREQVPGGIVKFDIGNAGPMTDEESAAFAEQWMKNFEGGRAVGLRPEPPAPTDDQLAAWVERNPKAFADWAARQARISGAGGPRTGQAAPARTPPVPVSDKTPKAPPVTRRRTTR